MASRPVKTNELRAKYRMSQPQVLDVLKKARIKPIEKIDMGARGTGLLWPNREANAALRTYREENPAKRRPGEAKRGAARKSNVADFSAHRQIQQLTKQVQALTEEVAKLTHANRSSRKVG